jgi:autotransporter-associated beta strand protein
MKKNLINTLPVSFDAPVSIWNRHESDSKPNVRKVSNLNVPNQFGISMKRCLMALLFSLSLFGANGLLLAQKTSIASGNWSNPAIWSPAGVPTTDQNVVIAAGHTVTLVSPANIGNGFLTVDGTLNRANQNFTAGSLSGASTGVITATNGILTIGSNNASTTYAGKLSGNLPTTGRAIRKTGSGTLTFTGQSDFAAPFNSQAVFVNAGTLKLGVSNALPAGSYLAVSAGATFDLNGFNQTLAAASSFSSTSSPIPAVLTNSAITASALTIDMPAGDGGLSWDATMTGNINLVVNGSDITNNWYWLSGPGIAFTGNTSVTGTATLSLGAALNGD